MRKRIYIDMDDTICDYTSQRNLEYNAETNPYPQSRVGFFLDLKPLPNAIEVIHFLKSCNDVYFLTRPSIYNTHSYTEKAEWIKKNFGFEWLDKLILCCNKSLLKGDYLIDDSDKDGQLEFEGKFLRFGKDVEWSTSKLLDLGLLDEKKFKDINMDFTPFLLKPVNF